jgi:hypothetical protein
MVDPRHRSSMSGIRVREMSGWGVDKACERYGKPQFFDGAPSPKDMSEPQFKATDGRGPDWKDDHPNDWIRARNEDGRSPNFNPGYKGKK